MTLVLDASAGLGLVMGRPERSSIAEALRRSDWIISPSLYLYETANALWKYHGLLGLELGELRLKLEQATGLLDETIPAEELFPEALRLACETSSPVYDAAYLAAARKRNAAVISLDQRLLTAARKLGIQATGV